MIDFADVDALAASYQQRGGQPGLAYGIVLGGELVHAAGLGERHLGGPSPDADTIFRIASMTKSFTASAILALRELVVGVALAVLKRRVGFGTLHVSLVGKTATLCLLYAFPLLLIGDHPGWLGTLARVIGWAFAIWGTVLYWWAAALYLIQVRSLTSAHSELVKANARP